MFASRMTTTLNLAPHGRHVSQKQAAAEQSAAAVTSPIGTGRTVKGEVRRRERLAHNFPNDLDCQSPASSHSQYELQTNHSFIGLVNKQQQVGNGSGRGSPSKPPSFQTRMPISHSSSNLGPSHARQLMELSSSMDQLNLRAGSAKQTQSSRTPHAHLRESALQKNSSDSLSLISTDGGSGAGSNGSGGAMFSTGTHGINVNITSVRSSHRTYQQVSHSQQQQQTQGQQQQQSRGPFVQGPPIEISFRADRQSAPLATPTAIRAAPHPHPHQGPSGSSPAARLRIIVADDCGAAEHELDDDRGNGNARNQDVPVTPDTPHVHPGFVKQRLGELNEQQASLASSLGAINAGANMSTRQSAFRPVVVGLRQQTETMQMNQSVAYSRQPASGTSQPYTAAANGTPAMLRRSYDPLFSPAGNSIGNSQLNPNAFQTGALGSSSSGGSQAHSARPPTAAQSVYAGQSSGAITSPNSIPNTGSLLNNQYALLSPGRVSAAYAPMASASVTAMQTPLSSGQSTVCATPTRQFDRPHGQTISGSGNGIGTGSSSIDSGVATDLSQSRVSLHQIEQKSHYENLLREKQLEVQHLRATMEQNEEAMTRVFEARKQEWFAEFEALRADADRRVAHERERCAQLEQQVHFLTNQLQQLHGSADASARLSQQVQHMELTQHNLVQQLDSVKWTLQQKQGELSLLRTQYKDSQNEVQTARQHAKQVESQNSQLHNERSQLENKVCTLETAMRELAENLEHVTRELLHIQHSKSVPVRIEASVQTTEPMRPDDADQADAQQEIAFLQNTIESREQDFERERNQWLEEKTKVINYQKQLQLNYLQMSQRNKRLEYELQQLQLGNDVIAPT